MIHAAQERNKQRLKRSQFFVKNKLEQSGMYKLEEKKR